MQAGGSALLVRRKGRAMPAELGRGGQQAERIDWRKSVLLNLVVQATYCLTVATCRSASAPWHEVALGSLQHNFQEGACPEAEAWSAIEMPGIISIYQCRQ